jgi:hypothetical protein
MKHGKIIRVGFEVANDVGWKELNFGFWVEERELDGVWVNLLFGVCCWMQGEGVGAGGLPYLLQEGVELLKRGNHAFRTGKFEEVHISCLNLFC